MAITVIDCPHDSIKWGYVSGGGGHSDGIGSCERCGLFISERDGRFTLGHNGQPVEVNLGA